MMQRIRNGQFHRWIVGITAGLIVGVGAVAGAFAKENGGAWLLEPVGARAISLQAYTALANDPASTTINPAGLAAIRRTQVLLYTRDTPFDAREHYFAVGGPIGEKGTLGIAWRHAGVTDSDEAPFIQTDAEGNEIGALGWKGNAFEVGFGYPVGPTLNVGGSLGLAFDSFQGALEGTEFADDQSASGFRGLTLGVTGVAAEVVHYGVALRNLGGSLGEDGSIPVVLSLAAAGRWNKLLASLELEKRFADIEEATTEVRGGVEYHLDPVRLRTGISQSADRSRVFVGFGVLVAPFQVDYAYQLINRASRSLGDPPRHFISISYLY